MKINKETKLWDVIKAFNWKWCVVTESVKNVV